MRPANTLLSLAQLTALPDASLEDAINNALKNYFPRLEPTNNVRVEFYDKFQRVADEYDLDFLNKYGTDLDTTLIFVGLFFHYALRFQG